jgi:hypothetical protein
LDGGTFAENTLDVVFQPDFFMQVGRFGFQPVFQLFDFHINLPQVDFGQFNNAIFQQNPPGVSNH